MPPPEDPQAAEAPPTHYQDQPSISLSALAVSVSQVEAVNVFISDARNKEITSDSELDILDSIHQYGSSLQLSLPTSPPVPVGAYPSSPTVIDYPFVCDARDNMPYCVLINGILHLRFPINASLHYPISGCYKRFSYPEVDCDQIVCGAPFEIRSPPSSRNSGVTYARG